MDVRASGTEGLPEHLDKVGIPAAILDQGQRILESNHCLADLLGQSEAELRGAKLSIRLQDWATSAKKLNGQDVFCRRCTEYGERWFRLEQREEAGNTLVMLIDVTSEHLVIEHLQFSSNVNDQLLEEAQIGVWRFDPDTKCYYFASALSLGYENSGRSVRLQDLDLIRHRDDTPWERETREQLVREGGAGNGEIRYRAASGEWQHFNVHYRTGRRMPSGLYEMYGISQNITPQAVARDEAWKSSNRLKLALKAANAAVYEYDYRKQSYWVSDELAQMIGIDEVKIPGDPPLELFAPEDREKVKDLARRMLKGADLGWVEVRLLTNKGPLWVRVYVEVKRDVDGTPLRAVGFALDIEEQKRQQTELEEARCAAESAAEAKSNFLASMSHEIRTPLNGVLGMAQSLFSDDLTEEQKEKVGIILDSGNTLMALLNDILDLSKIEAGKVEIVAVEGDLRASLKRAVDLFRPGADDKGVALNLTVEDGFPERLYFDPVRVRQCVSNLLSNAIKFTGRGGRVDLELAAQPRPDGKQAVVLTVTDTGIGMTIETMRKLFSAFSQGDDTTVRRFGGTGLGLAISRELAKLMGGDITVRSDYGVGSEFSFAFVAEPADPVLQIVPEPELKEDLQRSSTEQSGQIVLSGTKVLLVDDNAVNRQVIKLFLTPFSIAFTEAENGRQALEALEREHFDIVLLDIHMPVMDGGEAIKAIRGAGTDWRDIPVIALTADALSGDQDRYLAMGMTDYISKPVDRRELIGKMCAAIGRREPDAGDAEQTASDAECDSILDQSNNFEPLPHSISG